MIYPSTIPQIEKYFKPGTVEEAVSLLEKYGKEARLLAGGTDLVALMRNKAAVPKYLIDLNSIPGLDYIEIDEDGNLRIGALATLSAVETNIRIKEHFLLLWEAVKNMGSSQLRNIGTIIGNVCRASPSADSLCSLLALEAIVEITGPGGNRNLSLNQFCIGPGQTVLKSNEMVIGIKVPKLPTGTGTAFLKQTRVAEDLAKVNASAIVTVENGTCQDIRIALGGVAPTPIRARKAEAMLKGTGLDEQTIEAALNTVVSEIKPISDLRSTEEYRKELSKVLVKRVVTIAIARALTK